MNDLTPTEKLIDQWREAASPVFIVGPERSGTSMLYRSLCSNSRFIQGGGGVETFLFRSLYSPANDKLSIGLKNYLGSETALLQWIDLANNISLERDTNLITKHEASWRLEGKRIQKLPLEKKDLLASSFFHFAQVDKQDRRVIEKTPGHLFHTEDIFRVFPNARVLVCVRDPVEIIASHRRRLAIERKMGKDESSLTWLSKTTDDFIAYLKTAFSQAAKIQSTHGDKSMIINYNNITSKPKAQIEKVCAFLDISFEPAMLAIQNKAAPQWDQLLGKAIQKNDYDVSLFLTTSEINRIRKKLNWKALN